MNGEIMEPDEIESLSGAETTRGQERWLKGKGIPYRVESRGTRRERLIVSRFHVRSWIEGSLGIGATAQPNWSGVR